MYVKTLAGVENNNFFRPLVAITGSNRASDKNLLSQAICSMQVQKCSNMTSLRMRQLILIYRRRKQKSLWTAVVASYVQKFPCVCEMGEKGQRREIDKSAATAGEKNLNGAWRNNVLFSRVRMIQGKIDARYGEKEEGIGRKYGKARERSGTRNFPRSMYPGSVRYQKLAVNEENKTRRWIKISSSALTLGYTSNNSLQCIIFSIRGRERKRGNDGALLDWEEEEEEEESSSFRFIDPKTLLFEKIPSCLFPLLLAARYLSQLGKRGIEAGIDGDHSIKSKLSIMRGGGKGNKKR